MQNLPIAKKCLFLLFFGFFDELKISFLKNMWVAIVQNTNVGKRKTWKRQAKLSLAYTARSPALDNHGLMPQEVPHFFCMIMIHDCSSTFKTVRKLVVFDRFNVRA